MTRATQSQTWTQHVAAITTVWVGSQADLRIGRFFNIRTCVRAMVVHENVQQLTQLSILQEMYPEYISTMHNEPKSATVMTQQTKNGGHWQFELWVNRLVN